jgi:hypothetical protein
MDLDREPQFAGRGWIDRGDPAGLCAAWRRRSLASGWLAAEDWDSSAVDAVAAAACGGGPLRPACDRLGHSRAKAGIGIAETIDDLAVLFAVLDGEQQGSGGPEGPERSGAPGGPPLALVRAVAAGWAEEGMAQLSRGGCEDPLSGLVTMPYLRTRLAELYREAAQGIEAAPERAGPAETHRLLVAGWPRHPDPWRRMALAIVVGHDLRTVFPGGDTLTLARPDGVTERAIALVRARADLPIRYARLRRTSWVSGGAQIRMIRLPGLLPEALRLVNELTP